MIIISGSSAFAEDYEILLERPAKVGQKYELAVSGERSSETTTSMQGKVVREEKTALSAMFEGTVTVLKIDELKRESELKVVVSKCSKKVDGNDTAQEVLAKGVEFVVRLKGIEEEFLIDGKVVSKELAEVLDVLFDLPEMKITEDDTFGTKDRKKVGDSWAMNSEMMAKGFASNGSEVEAENIKGSMELEKVVEVDGKKCLRINGKFKMSKFGLPLQAWMSVEKSSMSGTSSGDFPVDMSIGRLVERMSMTMGCVAKGKPTPETPEITVTVNGISSKQMKRKYLK